MHLSPYRVLYAYSIHFCFSPQYSRTERARTAASEETEERDVKSPEMADGGKPCLLARGEAPQAKK